MYDFNHEEDQKSRVFGPIPAGSSVLVRLSIRQPKYPDSGSNIVGKTRDGILFLDAEYEVAAGQYEGVKIWENLWLPFSLQRASMNDRWKTACNIAGRKMKGMLNAAHRLMPKDDSPQARNKRMTQSWLDFNGLIFPVSVGIADEPNTKNGKTYWNNTISLIITPDMKQYQEVMDGGEIITDGPVTGSGERTAKKHAAGSYDDPGYEQAPATAYDADIPF